MVECTGLPGKKLVNSEDSHVWRRNWRVPNRNLANTAYTYDAENRLVVASTGAQLTYEPLGRLYPRAGRAPRITRFLYDGDNLVAEYDGSRTLLRLNAFGPDIDPPPPPKKKKKKKSRSCSTRAMR